MQLRQQIIRLKTEESDRKSVHLVYFFSSLYYSLGNLLDINNLIVIDFNSRPSEDNLEMNFLCCVYFGDTLFKIIIT